MIAGIRKVWSRYAEERKATLKAVRFETFYVKKDGTIGDKILVKYECAHCKRLHPTKNVQVDHIQPIGKQPPWPPSGNGEWDEYLLRVFCNQDNLQVLCSDCHKRKSAEERRNGAYK